MPAEPGSETGLIEVSGRKGENRGYDLFLGGLEAEAIQTEEEIRGLESDALVSIYEGVVVGETEAIGRSEGGKIGVRVVDVPVARSFEG